MGQPRRRARGRRGVEEVHLPAIAGELHCAPAVANLRGAGLAQRAAQRHRARFGGDRVDRGAQAVELRRVQRRGAKRAARGLHLVQPGANLRRRQLAVAAGAEHRAHDRDAVTLQRDARGEQHRVGQRAGEPGLVAVGEHVAADV